MRLEVFPTFSVYVHLQEFCAVELIHGYYQVRVNVKPSSSFDVQLSHHFSSSIDDSSSVNNLTGISRIAKIAFKQQYVDLDSSFKCRANATRRFDKCFEDLCLSLQLELWYMDPENAASGSMDNFRMISKRTLEIRLRTDKTVHCHRSVFFECFTFSTLSLTIHASLIGGRIFYKKPIGDSHALSNKLRQYHTCITRRFILSMFSLQCFMQRYSHVLTSPLKISTINCVEEEKRLREELEKAENGWSKLQEHVDFFSRRISALFNQLLQLFSRSKKICEVLLLEFTQQRMKQMSEAFFFSEESAQLLLCSATNQALNLIELVKKNDYLHYMPQMMVYVPDVDVNIDDMTIIVEQKFLPSSCSTVENLQQMMFGDGDARIKQQILANPEINNCLLFNDDELNNSGYGGKESKSIFDFCLPLSRHPKKNSGGSDDPYQASSKNLTVDSLDRRRMTDPGSNIKQPNGSLLRNNTARIQCHAFTNVEPTIKSHSLTEISPRVLDMDKDAIYAKYGSSSVLTVRSSSSESPSRDNGNGEDAALMAKLQSEKLHHVDESLIEFARKKESFKRRFAEFNYQGYLYSDSISIDHYFSCFSSAAKRAIGERMPGNVHLIVFAHGLEGSSDDLTAYRNYLRVTLPDHNLAFLMSEVNQSETWSDLKKMAENLLNEIKKYISQMPCGPTRISLVAHSLGGLIVRAMCGLPGMTPLLDKLYTLMTLNSPHCGLIYNQRTASWGVSLLQWWKQSACLEQLTMRDTATSGNLRETFLYRLSQNGALGLFHHVLLVGSNQDLYVPGHSALLEHCRAAMNDQSELGNVYLEMLASMHEAIVASSRHTTLVKYTVAHALGHVSRAQQMTGRAVHIAAVDDDMFVEKLITVSAAKYFK